MFIAILGATIPVFVLASLMQYVFAVKLGWFPASGWGKPSNMVLPVIVMGFGSVATYARYIKSSMLDTLGQDYVLTARAKGLSERAVILKHVLRNSLLPAVTIFRAVWSGCLPEPLLLKNVFNSWNRILLCLIN